MDNAQKLTFLITGMTLKALKTWNRGESVVNFVAEKKIVTFGPGFLKTKYAT